ncbi:MAG: bifunctional nuclease family protein [Muribaculaceae bacterium]|nr:bifunctional nuclease family protein [Muribaculaceae bacterium]
MENIYKLELIGITYNQIESGVYALILQQVGTTRRIPIIIGFPEAQAIECKLQEIKTPRPLTHDTMISSLSSFGIRLEKVMIKKQENGVFAADLFFTDGVNERIVDARSSDAVALAIRVNAPIYTTESVLLESGFDSKDKRAPRQSDRMESSRRMVVKPSSGNNKYESMTLQQLSEAMMKASEAEDYEEAARIKSEIDRRNENKTDSL